MPKKSPPDPAVPRRSDLAEIFKDQKTLRLFERLFEVGGKELPEAIEGIGESLSDISGIRSIIYALEDKIEDSLKRPDGIPEIRDTLNELKKSVEEANFQPGLKETVIELKELVESIILEPKIITDFIERLNVGTELLAGYVEGGNYFKTEETGFQESFGDARSYDDVYPSAVSIGRGASAPSITTYLTGTNFDFKAPEFPSAAPAKEITLHFQIYHSYDEGTPIDTHLHLYIPDDATGGDIVFDYEYYWANIGDTGAPTTTTGSATLTRAASAGIAQNYLFEIESAIVGTGKEISSILSITLSRDTADSFGSSVWLLSDDCHIRKNTSGSRQETAK
jgi:hypothetical protein